MWKRNPEIASSQLKNGLKRLHLDKKQNCPPLPIIQSKDQQLNNETQKLQKNPVRESSLKKKFSMTQKHRTMVPYLLKTPIEGTKSFRSLDKMRSQSDWFQKQGPVIQRKESQTRVRLINRNIMLQKQKKIELHLQDHRQPILKSIHNNSNRQEKNKKIQFVKTQAQSDSFQTSNNNTILEDNQQNHEDLVIDQIKSEPKQYQSIAVETDFQMNGDIFKDFLRFKITQKEKYQKLQQVFQFVDNISRKQLECFEVRYNKVKLLLQEPFQTIRQREIQNLVSTVDQNESRFLNSMQQFVNTITKTNKNQVNQNLIQIEQIKQQVNKLKKDINRLFEVKENQASTQSIQSPVSGEELIPWKERRRLQKTPTKTNNINIGQLPKNKNFINLQFQEKFSTIMSQLTVLEMKLKGEEEEIWTKLTESQQQIKKNYETWKFNIQERNYAIKVCVNEVMRLPEMSLSIFGMNKDEDNKDEKNMLKKIGVFLDSIPQFDEFYSTSNNTKKKHSSEYCFKEVLDFKCLNCAYLKSKMRFIYSKNKELQTVIKILNHLVGFQKNRKA